MSRTPPLSLEAENARLRSENADQRERLSRMEGLLLASSRQITELTAQVGKLSEMVARGNERIAELAAVAGRSRRKSTTTETAAAVASPELTPAQRKAFDERPRPPELPAKVKSAPKARKPTGRKPLPAHLPAMESTARPCARASCGGGKLDVVDSFDEEKLTVVAQHQRRRIVHRTTVRCRDCLARTTGEAPPAP